MLHVSTCPRTTAGTDAGPKAVGRRVRRLLHGAMVTLVLLLRIQPMSMLPLGDVDGTVASVLVAGGLGAVF